MCKRSFSFVFSQGRRAQREPVHLPMVLSPNGVLMDGRCDTAVLDDELTVGKCFLMEACMGDRVKTPLKHEEHLLVSKALPIFGTSYYFCACSDLPLFNEAYDLSSQSED